MVYAGAGTSRTCVAALAAELRRLAVRWQLQVRLVDARGLAAVLAAGAPRLVCIPGGRDLPYLWAMAGPIAAALRAFVEAGGRYFGSCAGAYFAGRALHFAAPRVPQICGRRPLGFFPGLCVGPSQHAAAFGYGPNAAAATLWAQPPDGPAVAVYNRGGCYFARRKGALWPRGTKVLAHARVTPPPGAAPLPGGEAPVAILAQVGRGRALLWGAHPELQAPGAARPSPSEAGRQQAPQLLRRHLAALLRSS